MVNIRNEIKEAFEVRANEIGFCLDQRWGQYENPYINNDTALAYNLFKDGWISANSIRDEELNGCVVVPENEFALLPKTITPEIEEILGMPCFKFIKAAQIYRQLGFDIPTKAENEQSFFMFKFLHLALVHGDKCFDVFESETKAMVEAARGGNDGKE